MKQQGHYQIGAFSCNLCRKEIRSTYHLQEEMEVAPFPGHWQAPLVCKECSSKGIIVPQMCQSCKKETYSIAVIVWNDYPIQEIATPLHEDARIIEATDMEVLIKESRHQRWCEDCVQAILNQAQNGEIDVFDFLTMDKDEREKNDILPAPIHETLREAVGVVLTNRSWIEIVPSIIIFHDRDGGYFVESAIGSPPLGHERLLPGAISAIIRKENDLRGILTGLIVHVYEAHLDGSIEGGLHRYQDGTLTKM